MFLKFAVSMPRWTLIMFYIQILKIFGIGIYCLQKFEYTVCCQNLECLTKHSNSIASFYVRLYIWNQASLHISSKSPDRLLSKPPSKKIALIMKRSTGFHLLTPQNLCFFKKLSTPLFNSLPTITLSPYRELYFRS